MIGKTVRFARDKRHGLQVGAKSLAIPTFPVNPNMNAAAHEIAVF